MIGLFDSGNGGLTIYQALKQRFPYLSFLYLGDHGNAPYGNRKSEDILQLTKTGVEILFKRGCKLVILACNTATAVAARKLQQDWLPSSPWRGHNILGIIAPTVEAATQTPWAVTSPQYPQKYNDDVVLLFATERTISSNVYPEEIYKRCPKVRIIEQPCPALAGAIEEIYSEQELEALVKTYVDQSLAKITEMEHGQAPHRAILGCTHYPIVRHLFEKHLPNETRIFCQPTIVADSLEDYLERHQEYISRQTSATESTLLTTGVNVTVPSSILSSHKHKTFFQNLL